MIQWQVVQEGVATLDDTIDKVTVTLDVVQFVLLCEMLAQQKNEGDVRVNRVIDAFDFHIVKK